MKTIKITPLLLTILSVIAFLLFIRLWAGAGSFPEIWELEEQITRQKQANEDQQQRNASMQADVAELGNSDAAIEEHARSELGMIKSSETFYQVILRDDAPEQAIEKLNPEAAGTQSPGAKLD